MADVSVVKRPSEGNLIRERLFDMDPFARMRQFTEDIDRIFGPSLLGRGDGNVWTPVVEMKEKDGKLQVTAELPGLSKDDLKVHIDGEMLVVEGERKREAEDKREGYYRSERSYGKFYRSILLPQGSDAAQAAAKFSDGVLEVTIPIPQVKSNRQDIPVQEGSKKAA